MRQVKNEWKKKPTIGHIWILQNFQRTSGQSKIKMSNEKYISWNL